MRRALSKREAVADRRADKNGKDEERRWAKSWSSYKCLVDCDGNERQKAQDRIATPSAPFKLTAKLEHLFLSVERVHEKSGELSIASVLARCVDSVSESEVRRCLHL